jgi:hypothetical protein
MGCGQIRLQENSSQATQRNVHCPAIRGPMFGLKNIDEIHF